jgi:hypothetical protein
MNRFYIFDHWAMPTPYNHRYFVEKLAQGFAGHGLEVKVVRSIEELSGPGYVMISNHNFLYTLGQHRLKRTFPGLALLGANRADPFKTLDKVGATLQRGLLQKLLKHCASQSLTVFAWFWFEHAELLANSGANVIFVGEKFWTFPETNYHRRWAEFCRIHENSYMIQFAAALSPSQVGENCVNDRYKVSFVGNRKYKPEWYSAFMGREDCRVIPTPPFISEAERVDIYRNSQVNLGLHSPVNISNGVVGERIYEALAYGCVCVTDNSHAVHVTDGCAQLVTERDEMLELVDRINRDAELRATLRRKGLSYAQAHGTYYSQATNMMKLSSQLFGD